MFQGMSYAVSAFQSQEAPEAGHVPDPCHRSTVVSLVTHTSWAICDNIILRQSKRMSPADVSAAGWFFWSSEAPYSCWMLFLLDWCVMLFRFRLDRRLIVNPLMHEGIQWCYMHKIKRGTRMVFSLWLNDLFNQMWIFSVNKNQQTYLTDRTIQRYPFGVNCLPVDRTCLKPVFLSSDVIFKRRR